MNPTKCRNYQIEVQIWNPYAASTSVVREAIPLFVNLMTPKLQLINTKYALLHLFFSASMLICVELDTSGLCVVPYLDCNDYSVSACMHIGQFS